MPTRSLPRIAAVDDDPSLLSILAAALRHHGFEVSTFADGLDLLAALRDVPPSEAAFEAVVMDVSMPGLGGLETCERLRSAGFRMPVLFLSALDTPVERVRGLTGGGDDYITKPFDLDELVARVHIALRRAGMQREASSVLQVEDLTVDLDAHRVTRHGVPIGLTSTEFRLLVFLLHNAGNVVSKTQILEAVWEFDFGGDASVVETYVYYLRRKIDTVEPKLIQTVRGAGYSLRVDR
jgi:two-component system, OmpR family, response regulator